MAVQEPNGTEWHDYGALDGKLWDTEVLACAEPSSYDITSNPRNYYDKATSLMDRKAVTALTAQVQAKEPGNYTMQQLLYAFDWVRENIEYADDPTDKWQSAEDTMILRSGDCEDHAILMATLMRELGGSARFNLIEGHAFATVFIGDSFTDLTAIKMAVSSHYGTLVPVHYLQDEQRLLDDHGHRRVPICGGPDRQFRPCHRWSGGLDLRGDGHPDQGGRDDRLMAGPRRQYLLDRPLDGLGAVHPRGPAQGSAAS